MYIELVNVTEAELDTAVDVVKTIDTTEMYPSAIDIENNSGDGINICYMTESEYVAYVADRTVSSRIPIADGGELLIDNLGVGITKIVVLGDGTHDAAIQFVVYKEEGKTI